MPIDKIIARHGRAMANLTAVIPIAQRVYVFDNSVEDADARLCARTSEGQVRKIYGDLPAWVADALVGIPRHEHHEDLRTKSI